MTDICVSTLTIIGSDNGLSPGRRQAIIWNNTGLLLIEPLGTNFSEISIGIQRFSFKKMHLNMSSAIWRPFCLGLNVLTRPPRHKGLTTDPFLRGLMIIKFLWKLQCNFYFNLTRPQIYTSWQLKLFVACAKLSTDNIIIIMFMIEQNVNDI